MVFSYHLFVHLHPLQHIVKILQNHYIFLSYLNHYYFHFLEKLKKSKLFKITTISDGKM
jgi:hypothetical protein